ncbi:MAG: GNAT family protein [Vicinamibacterales bacterium]
MELRLGTARSPRSQAMTLEMPTLTPTAAVVHTGVTTDWKGMLPVFQTAGVTLRALQTSDAPHLLSLLSTEEVARFVSPPPTTAEAFERFIDWTHRMRRQGSYACYAVVPRGLDHAVGILQVRALTPDFSLAEWGFAIGAQFWGSGLFVESATLTVDFAMDVIGVHRLEARAVTLNGRGNGALAKLGAVREATLRSSFSKGGHDFDQYLWSILAEDWHVRRGQVDWGGHGDTAYRLVA